MLQDKKNDLRLFLRSFSQLIDQGRQSSLEFTVSGPEVGYFNELVELISDQLGKVETILYDPGRGVPSAVVTDAERIYRIWVKGKSMSIGDRARNMLVHMIGQVLMANRD